MTGRQAAIVQETWEQLRRVGDDFVSLFLMRLFELDAGLRPAAGEDIVRIATTLARTVDTIVAGLPDDDRLEAILRELGVADMEGVGREHYATIGEAMLWSVRHGLGPFATHEVRDSWAAALAHLMQLSDASSSATRPGPPALAGGSRALDPGRSREPDRRTRSPGGG